MREEAISIFRAALEAVRPEPAVRRHLRLEGSRLRVGARRFDLRAFDRVRIFGAGKAFAAMAQAAEEVLGERICDGFGITSDGGSRPTRRVEIAEARHPLLDERGLAATARLLDLMGDGGPRDLVLFLLSGGASALMESLPEGISLEDLRAVNRGLLACGAPIAEVNAVRKQLSRVKGGRMAAALRGATCAVLVLSDVLGSPLDQIGSGPFALDRSGGALDILRRYDIPVAENIRAHLEAARPVEPPEVYHCIVGDNRAMVDAAVAASRGRRTLVLSDRLVGEAAEVGRLLAACALDFPPGLCVVGSGETTVTVRGQGRGGRNQEMALAFAAEIAGRPRLVLLCGASDGVDGPTDAAGAVVDGSTVERGTRAGQDVRRALEENDSYGFLKASGDLLLTGPTHTNVNDLYVLIS